MSLLRLASLIKNSNILVNSNAKNSPKSVRYATTTPTGALLPEPQKIPFGILGIVCAVIPGLLIGALISRNMANFLEENDLFVPSDDDDDDD